MTKIEMLCWGIQHIAENHGFKADINWQENGEVCIWGGSNIPTLSDVRMLCEDLGIGSENIDCRDYGIDVWLPDEEEWDGSEEYVTGLEFWRRVA